jgi:hypothetical protein
MDAKILSAPNEEIEIWQWLQLVLKTLGPDGTSSEESGVEDEIEIVYSVKPLPWRRDIDKELEVVDSTRIHAPNPFAPQGSKPVRRRRGACDLASTRDPVKFLPRALYDDEWFDEVNDREKQMKVRAEGFQWMNIIVGTGRDDSDE